MRGLFVCADNALSMKRSLVMLSLTALCASLLSGSALAAKVMRIHVVDEKGGVASAVVQLFLNHHYQTQKRTDSEGYTTLEIPPGDVCITASTRKPARSAEVCHNGLSSSHGNLIQIRFHNL